MTTTLPAPLPAPVAAPRASGDWLTLTLRMTRWYVFQMWRRVMSKVLLGLMLGVFALMTLGLLVAFAAARGASTETASNILGVLTFPRSTGLAVDYDVAFFGVIFTGILGGAMVGGEYGMNTLRLALSRGIGRGQVIAAQAAALLVVAFVAALGMGLVGTLVGVTLGPLLGGTPEGLTAAAIPQLLGYIGATGLRIFTYTTIALFFGTLARSAAGGIGGALGFVAAELVGVQIVTGIITGQREVARYITHQPVPGYVDTLTTIRTTFIQINADALVGAAREGPLTLDLLPSGVRVLNSLLPTPPSAAQALLVLLLWCAAMCGLSYWLTRRRDVTE
jgi:ABC-type transport system involved in multi-copper enzyme maturation permease subunit